LWPSDGKGLTRNKKERIPRDLSTFLLLQIRCAALNGHPGARISWEEPKGAIIDFAAEPVVHKGDAHTRSVYHTVTYKADLGDDGREITCVATQIDRDGRSVLYEASTRYVTVY
jgi:hypothetical protein